jgi:Cu-Zn family superoxide dismutase
MACGAAVWLGVAGLGCNNSGTTSQDKDSVRAKTADARPLAEQGGVKKELSSAVAEIEPTQGNQAKGTVTLTQSGGKVRVLAEMSGLKPNSKHAIHVHEGTECGHDGMKAGSHYNPDKHEHGLPTAANNKKHAGDWGNLEADEDGKAKLDLTVDNITINGAKNPVLGRAVIVHEKADDGSQPVGNAGARIGCGIIKDPMAKPAKQ